MKSRPLAEATLRRIARGIVKYVIEAQEPFIATLAHGEVSPSGVKRWGSGVRSLRDPLQTVLAGGNGAALCVPVISSYYGHKTRQGEARGSSIEEPLKTQTTENRHALVTAFLAKHYGGIVGTDLRQPIGTVTAVDHHSLVAVNIMTNTTGHSGASLNTPLPTITTGGHHAAVAALLVKYYGNERDGVALSEPLHTIPTHDRFGLVAVQIGGEPYVITDIGMRMLQPHELFAAQGFPENYQIDRGADGKPMTKSAQVRLCGNSVCPPVARAIVEANYTERDMRRAA